MGERLAEYPLLRTMLLNPWFALALTGVVLTGLAVLICLPKMWTSSPEGFRPVFKVSLLDLMQARALRASAERKAAQGDHLGAAIAWQSAVGNNPGNLELYRGALRHLGAAPELPMRVAGRTLAGANWLLRLGGTNRVDFEILAGAFSRYGMSEEVYGLLQPMADDLSPELQGAYLKALFAVGGYEDFGARWEAMRDQLPDDPTLALHRTAYLAGWGPVGESEANLRTLMAAMEDVHLGPLACRLVMAVSRQRLEPDRFAEALQRQQERAMDLVVDHTQFWHLLVVTGRKAEAQRLARTFNRPPRTAYDVVVTAEALAELDLSDLCLEYLQRHAMEFGGGNNRWSVAVWATYADQLIAGRHWERLKDIATEMRALPEAQGWLSGFGRFLEGRVAFAQGAVTAARAAFEEAVTAGFPMGRVGIRVGESLSQMGFPDLALRALSPLESRFSDDVGYWRAMFDAVYALREDEVLLLKAATRAHTLEPRSVEWQFNYAAALLIGQWRVEEALGVTRRLLTQHPQSVGARINHAIALCFNGRVDEARTLLETVRLDELRGPQRAAARFGWLGVHRAQEAWEQVRTELRALDGEPMFPRQRRWVEEIRQALPVE